MGFVYLNSAKPFPGRSKDWGVGCAFVMQLLSVQGRTWGKRGLFQAQIGVQGWATLWECFPLPITPVGSRSHSLRGVRFPTGKNEWEFPKLSRALALECNSTELSIYSLQVSGTVSSLLRSFLQTGGQNDLLPVELNIFVVQWAPEEKSKEMGSSSTREIIPV